MYILILICSVIQIPVLQITTLRFNFYLKVLMAIFLPIHFSMPIYILKKLSARHGNITKVYKRTKKEKKRINERMSLTDFLTSEFFKSKPSIGFSLRLAHCLLYNTLKYFRYFKMQDFLKCNWPFHSQWVITIYGSLYKQSFFKSYRRNN